jgi:hypothetical protein
MIPLIKEEMAVPRDWKNAMGGEVASSRRAGLAMTPSLEDEIATPQEVLAMTQRI